MNAARRWHQRLAPLAVIILLASMTSGCRNDDGAADGTITLSSLTDDTGMPLWLADKLGYFEDNGLDVDISYAASGAAALPSGVAGDWQAGWIGSPPALSGWEKFGLLSFPHIKEERNLKLLARNDYLKSNSPAEILQQQKVGTSANSTFQNVLYACARHFDVDPSDIEVVPLDPPQVRQAIAAREIAAGTTSAAGDFELVNDNAQYTKVCDGKQAGADFISNYMVTPGFWADDPDTVAKFLDAVYRANEFIRAHPKQAVEHMVEFNKEIGLDTSPQMARYSLQARTWLTLNDAVSDMADGTTSQTLTELADFFVETGVYESAPDIDQLVEESQDALQAAQDYRDQKS